MSDCAEVFHTQKSLNCSLELIILDLMEQKQTVASKTAHILIFQLKIKFKQPFKIVHDQANVTFCFRDM